jgi:hypothetical protein
MAMKKLLLLLFIALFAQSSQAQTLESDTVDILHYNINLDVVYLSQKQISGFTQLQIQPRISNLDRLKLDLLHLTVDSVLVNNQSKTWNYNDTLLHIPLGQSYNPTDTLDVKVFYHGQPVVDPTGWGGFYFSNDSLYAFNLGVGFGDDPHNYGRVFFPCLDDFQDRATYDFHITTKADKGAVCNGLLQSKVEDTINNINHFHWRISHSIPTYLVGLAVGPYQVYTDTFHGALGNIPIDVYVPSNKLSAAAGSFNRLTQILDAFEWAYGPYVWERVGYVGIPFGSGAMEHATNIALGLGFIDGTHNYESLIAHELSHHWFGDLVTTNSAPEMWINEGWAVYSENLYKEILDGKEIARDEMRSLLKTVIQRAHLDDGGYWTLDALPHSATYGTHAYDKGATVAHSIRGYLGDTVFFSMLKAYFSQNAFTHMSNEDFRDFITTNTGVNMNGFFDGWIYQAGFTHFSVDSFAVLATTGQYDVQVYLRQKLRHKSNYVQNNRVRIRLADDQWNFADRMVEFSGMNGVDQVTVPFVPTHIFVDPEAVLADATTDYYSTIKNTGLINYADAYFKLDVNQVSDSALFFVTHNWVAPDTDGTAHPGLHLSSSRYWTVEGIFPAGFDAQGQFFYSRFNELDGDIINSSLDSMVILYRPGAGHPWQSVGFTRQGIWTTGWLKVDHLQPGQYALASWDAQYAGIEGKEEKANIRIYPNPTQDYFYVEVPVSEQWTVKVSDTSGRLLDIFRGSGWQKLRLGEKYFYQNGVYFITVYDGKNQLIHREKLVYQE